MIVSSHWLLVPDFSNQPVWVNMKHVIQVRCQTDGKAVFYFSNGGILHTQMEFASIPYKDDEGC